LASSVVAWLLILLLAYALYVTLAPVNKRLAQIALLLELGHAWIGCITMIFSYMVMRLYTTPQSTPFTYGQQEYLIGILNGASGSAFNAAMMFVGAASVLFFYLFLQANYIPRMLAGLGLLASAVLIVVSLGQLLLPEFATLWQYGWAPMGIAEVATALWLVFAGIRNTPTLSNSVAATPSVGSALDPVSRPNV
jgi:hypothetical protein